LKKKPINILITAASRRVALIRSFSSALEKLGYTGNVVVSDTDRLSPGLFFCKGHYEVPLSTSPDYINAIKDVCRQENITLLVPTIDEELPIFGRHKKEFEEMGVKVAVSNEAVGDICNDKYKTYLFFKKHGLPIARTYLPDEVRKNAPELPLFIKPRTGRGAVAAFPVKTKKELDFFLDYINDPVIQDFLPGREYTVDVLCDFQGRVISVVPRERLVIRSGVTDRGKTFKNQKLIELSAEVASTLGIVGAANLQCKIDNGKITFFEINPRFSGAIQLTINAGADFPAMMLEAMNGGVKPRIGDFKDNLVMVSYEESLYHSS